MLLDGIYYGKTPISRAYKNGQIIWSLGEDKNLEVNISDGLEIVSRITPAAAKLVADEYQLTLNNQITASCDITGNPQINHFVFNDIGATMGLQESIALTPYTITFIFDVIGNLQGSRQIAMQHGLSTKTPTLLKQTNARIVQPNTSININESSVELEFDKSELITVTDKYINNASALGNCQTSHSVEADGQIDFQTAVLGSPDKAEIIFMHRTLDNKTSVNLIQSVAKLLSAEKNMALIFASQMNQDNAKKIQSFARAEQETHTLISNDTSIQLTAEEKEEVQLLGNAHNAGSSIVQALKDSVLDLAIFASLNETQVIEAVAPSELYIVGKYRNDPSRHFMAHWSGELNLTNYANNSESEQLIIKSQSAVSGHKHLNSCFAHELEIIPSIKTLLLDGLNFSASMPLQIEKTARNLFKFDMSSSEGIALTPVHVSEIDPNAPLNISLDQPIIPIYRIDTDVHNTNFTINSIRFIFDQSLDMQTKHDAEILISSGLDTQFTHSSEEQSKAEVFLSEGLKGNFYNSAGITFEQSTMEIYRPQDFNFNVLRRLIIGATLQNSNISPLFTNDAINVLNKTSQLDVKATNKTIKFATQCANKTGAILSLVKWEYPKQEKTNLFISQAFLAKSKTGRLDIE